MSDITKKMLDLSTSHAPKNPDFGSLRSVCTGFGWVCFVGDPDMEDDVPEWLSPILKYAFDSDCILITFDSDATVYEQFPTYEGQLSVNNLICQWEELR